MLQKSEKRRCRQRVLRKAAEVFCKERQRFDFSQGVVLRTGDGNIPHPVANYQAIALNESNLAWTFDVRSSRIDLDEKSITYE